MAEVAQGAAHLVRRGDDTMLEDALDLALERGKEAPEVAQRRALGIAVASGFTWASSVSRHVEAYRAALGAPL
jgi:hypothetical protein